MSDRRGFSLVEMVIVLVLAGIVSTAAVTMFSTQNKLNARMTALAESQESARSAVTLAASELRGASVGSIIEAEPDLLTIRLPVVVGIICARTAGNMAHIFFPLNGRTIDMRSDVDGKAVWNEEADDWNFRDTSGGDRFSGAGSRNHCISAGNGLIGSDADYASIRMLHSVGFPGDPVLLYREVSFYLAESALGPDQRGFYRAEGGSAIELAHGFSSSTRFEYQLEDGSWDPTPRRSHLRDVQAIRLIAEVVGEGASGAARGTAKFSLTREVHLMDHP